MQKWGERPIYFKNAEIMQNALIMQTLHCPHTQRLPRGTRGRRHRNRSKQIPSWMPDPSRDSPLSETHQSPDP